MSWNNTYSHTLLIAIDQLGAAVFFNRPDLTISTMCWMVQSCNDQSLKPSKWQRAFLIWLAPKLDKIQAHRCEGAAFADFDRANNTLIALGKLRTMARRPT